MCVSAGGGGGGHGYMHGLMGVYMHGCMHGLMGVCMHGCMCRLCIGASVCGDTWVHVCVHMSITVVGSSF